MSEPARSGPRPSRRTTLAGAGVALAVIAVLAALAVLRPGQSGTPSESAAPRGQGQAATSARPTVPGPSPPPVRQALTLGSDDAPVTIVEFGDFQCPQCGRYAREIEPVLKREYVETGAVQLVWRDFPAFGEQSVKAAVAARAAGRQGHFWEYHDALYADQFPVNSGKLTDEYLISLARELGLDMTQFRQDLADSAAREAVMADYRFGQQLGVPGTPAFLINNQPVFGAQSLEVFEKAIERARREAR